MKESFQFFNELSDEEMGVFLGFCENRQADAGETLWREGDSDSYAVFVISGRLGIKRKTEFEGKYMIVGTYGRGAVAGELCLLTDYERSDTAAVLEPVDMAVLSSRNFERLITEQPMLGLKLLKCIFLIVSRRLDISFDRITKIF
jgi:CRP-like cAMP-binding protein